jgi:hypothetical protein
MKGAEIGSSTGVFAKFDSEYGPRVSERLVGFVEEPLGLRCHRSMPSRRISCINGVRSR